jgi:hypothetical protein
MAGNGIIFASSVSRSIQRAGVGRRDPFFFGMSIVLLLTVLIGFLPTLYLRGFRDLSPLPGHLHVHGAILTAWFVWLVVQTSLIKTNRVAHHRRLGGLGAILGLAVVFAGPLATFNLVPRIRAAGLDLEMDISALGVSGLGSDMSIARFLSGTVVWPNIASVATFAVLLLAALFLRRRPDTHKRLMLLASISIVGPALARISRWPVLGGEQGPFIPLALVLLLLAVVLHDVISTRRMHPATLLGAAFAVLMTIGGLAIGTSQFGEAFVREM